MGLLSFMVVMYITRAGIYGEKLILKNMTYESMHIRLFYDMLVAETFFLQASLSEGYSVENFRMT